MACLLYTLSIVMMVPLLFFIEYMCYLNLTNRVLSVCPIYVLGQSWHFEWQMLLRVYQFGVCLWLYQFALLYFWFEMTHLYLCF